LVLPPARLTPPGDPDESLPGAFHVHTNRSDGRSSPDEVAAAAARAGLRFLVFTDHGDGTRAPEPPTYRSGVLCLDGVEITTDDGHLIALGLREAAPYPLAGEGRDVLEDVHRLGGVGIAAHPDSPRSGLQWYDWDVPLDGLELINLDTVWRRQVASGGWRMGLRVARSLSTYLVRPSEAMAALVTERDATAERWLTLAAKRHIAMFAGVDAHARLALRSGDPDDSRWALAFPGYEAIFKTLTMRVRTERPLTGDAAVDGAQVLEALTKGRSYAVLDGVASPPTFDLTATINGATRLAGDEVVGSGPVRLTVRTNAPASFTTTLWRGGEVLLQQPASPEVTVDAPEGEALYRAEIRATDREHAPPWVVSNGLMVRTKAAATPHSAPQAKANPLRALFDSRTDVGWLTESSPDSRLAIEVTPSLTGRELHVRYGLPGGDVGGQYVATLIDLGGNGLAAARGVRFGARSDGPMRLSVQLRVPGSGEPPRWRRSVYLDSDSRAFDLPLDDFRPIRGVTPAAPPLADVRTLIFVVDQTNTRPGTSGHFWLRNVELF
jgi:hypothetical protein